MQAARKQYNYCLDFIKGIACIFVVFMHCEFPGVVGVAVQAIGRFSVPFFFMVSGYFCFSSLRQCRKNQAGAAAGVGGIRRKVMHIAKITLFASLFYLVFVLIQHVLLHNQDFTITWRQLFNWIVFNSPRVIAGQYWFLFALLYAYIFYGILERFHLRRFTYVLAGILFVVYICLAQGAHLAGLKIPNMYYRNWLIEAFPFFMLGHWIHENEKKINIPNKVLLAIIIVTSLLCWVERWIMGRDFGVNIVTIPQVFALFVYGANNPTHCEGVLQRLGRDCSMLVYILHPAVWHSIDGLYGLAGISTSTPALYLRPLLVLALSIILAILFNGIVSLFKGGEQQRNDLIINS
jgi:surface polysaccharide O-acyltransferase-like enzyme